MQELHYEDGKKQPFKRKERKRKEKKRKKEEENINHVHFILLVTLYSSCSCVKAFYIFPCLPILTKYQSCNNYSHIPRHEHT